MFRAKTLGLMAFLMTVAVMGTPAQASSWLWGQKKTGPGVILGGVPNGDTAPVITGREAMTVRSAQEREAPADPRRMNKHELKLLGDQLQVQQQSVAQLSQEQMDKMARDQAIIDANRALSAQQEAVAQQQMAAMAAALAKGGPLPVVAQPVAGAALTTTGTVRGGTSAGAPSAPNGGGVQPYVSPKVPVKDWDAINKAKESPAITPYVVVPKSVQGSAPAKPTDKKTAP